MICFEIMEDPIVLLCQCSVCKVHVKDFQKIENKIRCNSCESLLDISLESLQVNKRFKAAIESEVYLTEIERQQKNETKTVMEDLMKNIDNLKQLQTKVKDENYKHFNQIHQNIDDWAVEFKNKIDSYAQKFKDGTTQIKEEFEQKITGIGGETKRLNFDFDKRSKILDDLFRKKNVSDKTINANKQDLLANHQHTIELENKHQHILDEIRSISFKENFNFNLSSFGTLHSSKDQNLCRFENQMEVENESSIFANTNINNGHFNLESNGVSSTTQFERNDTSNSTTPEQHDKNDNTDTDAGDYNEESDQNNDFNADFNDVNVFDSNFNENDISTDFFVSLEKSSKKSSIVSNGSLSVYNVNTLEKIEVSQMAFKTNKAWCMEIFQNNKIFIGTCGGRIKMFHLYTAKHYSTLSGHTKRIDCLKVLPAQRLASGAQDKLVKIWDIKTSICLLTLKNTSWINCIVEYLPDDKIITGSNDGIIKVWSSSDGMVFKEIQRTLNKKDKKKSLSVYCIQLLDKHRIICGDGVGALEIWDLEKSVRIQTMPYAHDKHIWNLNLMPSGQLVTSSGDLTIKVFHLNFNKKLKNIFSYFFLRLSVIFLLGTLKFNLFFKVWSIQEGLINKDFKILDTKGHLHEFLSFLVRKDGLLISGSWIGIKRHDLTTEICTDIKETKAVDQLSFCGK
jgi:hypothetical protein